MKQEYEKRVTSWLARVQTMTVEEKNSEETRAMASEYAEARDRIWALEASQG
jgi:hypothetical protein